MKILHTSDWHIGHTLYNYDRALEQQHFFDQLAHIVANEKPDVMVVSGDIYHTAQPSAASQTLYTEAMLEVSKACPSMQVVVTAGNHDSSSKLEIDRSLWNYFKVTVVGRIDADDPEKHIVAVSDQSGAVKGYVVAMPYVNSRMLPDGFYQQLLDRVAERNVDGLPVVMMAHLAVCGCNITGHDCNLPEMVGGIDYSSVDSLGCGYDYLALGHIHKPQFVGNTDKRVRYSGTPMAISFDEDYEHSVSIVEIGKHGDAPQVRTVEIDQMKRLVSIPAKNEYGDFDDVIKELKSFPADVPAYIRLNVMVDGALPVGSDDLARQAMEGKMCDYCLINTCRKVTESARSEEKVLTLDEIYKMNPADVIKSFIIDSGLEFGDDEAAMLQQVMDEVKADQENN